MIPHNRVVLTAEDRVAVARVLDSGQIGQGPEVAAFERELAARFRPGGEAVCVSSGTAALHLAAQALRIRPWIPSYACSALWHALRFGGNRPRLFDCDAGTLNTPQATVVVHTYGALCPVADDAIEDFTHAPGAILDGRPCGSFGAASIISFGATKPLGCGSGSAVLGPSDLIAAIRDMRDYDGKRDLCKRFNWQWHDMGAALGRSRLKRLDDENARRWERASAYAAVAYAGRVSSERVWYRYVIRVDDPASAIAYFAERGVEAINPLLPWELLHRRLGLRHEDFPNAEDAAAHTVSLPNWPGMTNGEVHHVASVLAGLEAAA